jgi:hypothetical protein
VPLLVVGEVRLGAVLRGWPGEGDDHFGLWSSG